MNTFSEALILIDEHDGRLAEHCHAGNRLAATSTIERAIRDGVPMYKIAVFARRACGGFYPVRVRVEQLPIVHYRTTFEE